MTVTGLGWREVLEAIKATRPIANPNPGFRQQLEEFGWGSSRKVGTGVGCGARVGGPSSRLCLPTGRCFLAERGRLKLRLNQLPGVVYSSSQLFRLFCHWNRNV